MNQQNPFPGMNPWMELSWPDVHTRVIGYISDALAPQLPPDLRVRTEERIAVTTEAGAPSYRADVTVTEAWKHGLPPAWSPGAGAQSGTVLAEPEIVPLEPDVERWVEIRTRGGELVTVIELLSPTNKSDGAAIYRSKQDDIIRAGVNLVEIDLLRAGKPVLRVEPAKLRPREECCYRVCVSRAARAGLAEVYDMPLRQRLPAFRVPLRAADQDIVLDLQPLIDRCYQFGAYWQCDYASPPGEPWIDLDARWAGEMLVAAGFSV
ncbi:MAG TPA: DUF4058 family protein [Verrucomicrobiales bacterium]|nr:DUF4058 family protein [Verrucomicrobiales bacterium]